MQTIILVGHGSPKKDANRMELVGRMLEARLRSAGGEVPHVMTAYLQFEPPTLEDTIDRALKAGATDITIHPYFLSAGMHVTKDIPEIIAAASSANPEVRFTYTEPLGMSEELVSVVAERLAAARGIKPSEIEARSFEILTREADFSKYPTETHPIIKRVVHTTADFDFAGSMLFHPQAIAAGLRAIKAGMDVLTDVEMVKAGVNAKGLMKFGGKVHCLINDAASASAHSEGRTRTEAAIEHALINNTNIGIVAIGNAPTALLKCIEVIRSGKAAPALVIGVPVGFVRAQESKAALTGQEFPYITNAGRKGGSTVAAAIVNALIKLALEGNEKA